MKRETTGTMPVVGLPWWAIPDDASRTRKLIPERKNTMANEKNQNTAPATVPENTTAPETAPDIIADDSNDSLELSSDVFGKINLARDIAGGGKGYCTMTAENKQAKATLYNAVSNPAKISDHINKEIKMIHFYVEIIQCANESTGGVVNVPRVVLIDETGKGYQAVSVGVYNAVKRIVAMFGNPATWDEPVTVIPQNVDLGGGQHTFNLIVKG